MTQDIIKEEEAIIQEIKRYSKRFIEELGGFYPFAVGTNESNEIFSIAAYEGNEFPMSEELIELLTRGISAEISNNKISLAAICVDIFLHETINGIKSKRNAIEIRFMSTTAQYTKHLFYEISIDGTVLFLNIASKI